MKEHHFIVSYSKENGWIIDLNIEQVKYPDGTIFNYETSEWELSYIGDGEYNDNDDEITGTLGKALKQLNEG
jgi:hypothetical protein